MAERHSLRKKARSCHAAGVSAMGRLRTMPTPAAFGNYRNMPFLMGRWPFKATLHFRKHFPRMMIPARRSISFHASRARCRILMSGMISSAGDSAKLYRREMMPPGLRGAGHFLSRRRRFHDAMPPLFRRFHTARPISIAQRRHASR